MARHAAAASAGVARDVAKRMHLDVLHRSMDFGFRDT
jgi:hypothetical protein